MLTRCLYGLSLCSAGLAPLPWVWFELAVYSTEWGFSCWRSTGCWCPSAPHQQEVASFLINWVLVLLLELLSHVPVSITSAKLCLMHHWAPSWGAWDRSWDLGKLWREGAGGSRPRAWKTVCTRVEHRGKEKMLGIQKPLRLSGFPFGKEWLLSWTAEMLLAV